jgi:poly-gamma-glutamate synthesis protein (capsule biosynthesis protein)
MLGFNLASCANNHALDRGLDGMRSTLATLRSIGISYAGCGMDLGAARAPAFLTQAGLRVALISVATSVSPESRATARRGDVAGRGGVNALRFAVHVTLDPASYRALQGTGFTHAQGDNQMEFFGTTVSQGDGTKVEYVSDRDDARDLLNAVSAAKALADIVIVSLHSHEPVNASPVPAKFVEKLAHDAIDAGATIVVGHGPHRLRGIELFHGGMIFYSLGDFLYQRGSVSTTAYDAYDSGSDPQAPALGALSGAAPRMTDAPAVLQGAMAVITFAHTKPESARLVPFDLGDTSGSLDAIPRLATGAKAAAIMESVRLASSAYGTTLTADGHAVGILSK